MVLARDVLTAARDAHPALDKQSTPDAVALRRLAQLQQGWLDTIALSKRDAVHQEQTVTLATFDFVAGAAIDAHLQIHGGKVTFTDTQRRPRDLVRVDYPERLHRIGVPFAYIQARRLFLTGIASDWVDVASVTLDLFPAGPDQLALDDALILPGQCTRAGVAAIAAFMAGRVTHTKVQVEDPAGAIASYLDEATDRRRAKVGLTREVY